MQTALPEKGGLCQRVSCGRCGSLGVRHVLVLAQSAEDVPIPAVETRAQRGHVVGSCPAVASSSASTASPV